jgi:negative regulator of sigma-B (phosphoserine phosphatase)
MTSAVAQREQSIEWSVASRALPGELVSGDLHVVNSWDGGALIGVVDGLGHGEEATEAAREAVRSLEHHARESLVSMVQHCHRALIKTRGVVMTLASLDTYSDTLTVIGIGNVETMIFHPTPRGPAKREAVLLRGGVVGYQLPPLQTAVLPISLGDVVVFATDGVREDFSEVIDPRDPLEQIVAKVMAQKFRGTDDGLVLACKYRGKP